MEARVIIQRIQARADLTIKAIIQEVIILPPTMERMARLSTAAMMALIPQL
jgi:hypothetical protein